MKLSSTINAFIVLTFLSTTILGMEEKKIKTTRTSTTEYDANKRKEQLLFHNLVSQGIILSILGPKNPLNASTREIEKSKITTFHEKKP